MSSPLPASACADCPASPWTIECSATAKHTCHKAVWPDLPHAEAEALVASVQLQCLNGARGLTDALRPASFQSLQNHVKKLSVRHAMPCRLRNVCGLARICSGGLQRLQQCLGDNAEGAGLELMGYAGFQLVCLKTLLCIYHMLRVWSSWAMLAFN